MATKFATKKVKVYETISPLLVVNNADLLAGLLFGHKPNNQNISIFNVDEKTGHWIYQLNTDKIRVGGGAKSRDEAQKVVGDFMGKANEKIRTAISQNQLPKDFPLLFGQFTKLLSANPVDKTNKEGKSGQWIFTYRTELPATEDVSPVDDKWEEVTGKGNATVLSDSIAIRTNGGIVDKVVYRKLPVTGAVRVGLYNILEVPEEGTDNLPTANVIYKSFPEISKIVPFVQSTNDLLIPVSDASVAAKDARDNLYTANSPFAEQVARQDDDKDAHIDPRSGIRIKFVKKAPPQAITISEFIRLLKIEESKYSEAEQRNTKVMLTRLRKVFYGSAAWDKYLITSVTNIKSPFGDPVKFEIGRRKIRTKIGGGFDLIEYEYYPKDATDSRAYIYLNQEVMLEKGSHKGIFIDMGHVLSGLDANNHPSSVTAPVLFAVQIDRNIDAVTWIGDIGSALAEGQILRFQLGRFLNDSEIQQLTDKWASPQDMLGNIDSYAIIKEYDTALQSTNGKKVSEILTEFYLGSKVAAQEKRYQAFAENIGAALSPGMQITNRDYLKKYFSDQINDSAALYIGGMAKGNIEPSNAVQIVSFIAGMSINKFSDVFAESFLRSLETALSFQK